MAHRKNTSNGASQNRNWDDILANLVEGQNLFRDFVTNHMNNNSGNNGGGNGHHQGDGVNQVPLGGNLLDRFKKIGPLPFSGTTDPEAAEKWIKQVNKTFLAMNCPEDQKLPLTAFILQGEAEHWYEALVTGYRTARQALTWAEFEREFDDKFIPKHVWDRKKREFQNLQQGSMTVAQYDMKWTQLSRYAPTLISTEEDKITRFIEGLRPGLRREVEMAEKPTLAETIRFAYKSEESATRDQRAREASRVGPTSSSRPPALQQQQAKRLKSNVPTPVSVPICAYCNRRHPMGQCRFKSGACFNCGDMGHKVAECPRPDRRKHQIISAQPQVQQKSLATQQKPPTARPQQAGNKPRNYSGGAQIPRMPAQAYAITDQDPEATNEVVEGTLLIEGLSARVLFDSGSTLSFVTPHFASHFSTPPSSTISVITVTAAMGNVSETDKVYLRSKIQIGDHTFLADLVVLGMHDYDVILGMDWLAAYHVHLDCHKKTISIAMGEANLIFQGDKKKRKTQTVSALKVKRMIRGGCEAFIAFISEDQESQKLEDVPIAKEFPDVFPDDVPGLPPVRELEFSIDLLPGAEPISKAPYCMAPAELHELKKQLQELLDKKFIRPSVSPWGAPILFVKKKDGSMRMCVDYR
ncbi:hypothetical protein AAC387_Pa10g0401 [Persea americana]